MALDLGDWFSLIISGPSGSGKSTFVHNLLDNLHTFTTEPYKKIYYCVPHTNSVSEQIKNHKDIEIVEGLPQNLGSENGEFKTLIIIDDLHSQANESSEIAEYFTRKCHHTKTSIILISHNLLAKSKFSRLLNLNTKFIVYFNNCRDSTQLRHIFYQIFGKCSSRFLAEINNYLTQTPYSYLVFDFRSTTPNHLRILTDIFNPHYTSTFCSEYDIDTCSEKSGHNETFGTTSERPVSIVQ